MCRVSFHDKNSSGSRIREIIYVTDSSIALNWCSNENIKLRLFVYNRVMTSETI